MRFDIKIIGNNEVISYLYDVFNIWASHPDSLDLLNINNYLANEDFEVDTPEIFLNNLYVTVNSQSFSILKILDDIKKKHEVEIFIKYNDEDYDIWVTNDLDSNHFSVNWLVEFPDKNEFYNTLDTLTLLNDCNKELPITLKSVKGLLEYCEDHNEIKIKTIKREEF